LAEQRSCKAWAAGSSPASGFAFSAGSAGNARRMTQYEQENDLGGGGEVDDQTMDAAWKNAAERQSSANTDSGLRDEDADEPSAKTSRGDA
jgi:hypothetical protein